MLEAYRRATNPMRPLMGIWDKEARAGPRLFSKFKEQINELTEEIKSRGPVREDDVSIAAHLRRLEHPEGGPLPDDLLAAEVGVYFAAGIESAGNAMSWTLYLISEHEEVQKKLEAELNEFGFLATPENPKPQTMEFADLGKMTYLQWVCKEAMRLLPVASSGVTRKVKRNLILKGFHIPAGSIILCPFYAAHRFAGNWPDQPDEFRPGPRQCIGQSLARMMHDLGVAMLFANFRFKLARRMGGQEGFDIPQGTPQTPNASAHSTEAPPWWRVLKSITSLAFVLGVASLGLARPAFARSSTAEQPQTAQRQDQPQKSLKQEQLEQTLEDMSQKTVENLGPIPENWDQKRINQEYNKNFREWMAPEELDTALVKEKKGKKVDRLESRVPDPANWDTAEAQVPPVQTLWKPEKMKKLTYTQFWNLVKEHKVDKVKFTPDWRVVEVTTNSLAPGGVRTERIGLPPDPDLYDHLALHGVIVETMQGNHLTDIALLFCSLGAPFILATFLIQKVFLLGLDVELDGLHGGKMERIKTGTTFNDIAGVDEVKDEVMEVVQFLRNPRRFLDLGARSPSGVLLVGPPGTGKTLLARAVAGEAGVPFFSVAGSEFEEMYVGVGAARVRGMFEQARKNAPCILFMDEFDGVGKQRSATGQESDDSVQTINQLLTEMDGFDDNTGVVVMAATNRPAALDNALTRPGRFDRVIHLTLPNLEGRAQILEVHKRGKRVDEDIDFRKVARATAGFTGADLMNLMNASAVLAVRQGQTLITEPLIFQALENIHQERMGHFGTASQYEEVSLVPPALRKSIAVYHGAKALLGMLSPEYDELSKVSVCPGGRPSGYTYFIPSEERLESKILTRGFMETRMVVALAGRCAERLVLGPSRVSTAGASDLAEANSIAQEMIFRCGFSRRLGPVAMWEESPSFLGQGGHSIAQLGGSLGSVALQDIEELMEGAQAKALYGLTVNYKALSVLVETLLERDTLTGAQVAEILEQNDAFGFPDPYVEGFGWSEDGELVAPGLTEEDLEDDEIIDGEQAEGESANANGKPAAVDPIGVPMTDDEIEHAAAMSKAEHAFLAVSPCEEENERGLGMTHGVHGGLLLSSLARGGMSPLGGGESAARQTFKTHFLEAALCCFVRSWPDTGFACDPSFPHINRCGTHPLH
ncbi:hypothetical protein WJX73_008508 [Symbiochloris irregularis]|uniref:AAA+ ATPase domain-containing protein n=1 Tax=Symbiochloris irregularis TaxID=706552 RepID=A0AAW1PUA4_9CHLO